MKNLIAALLISLSVFIAGCIFGNDDNGENENKTFTFPLEVGNRWEYTREMRYFNFRPDSTANAFKDTLSISPTILEIVRTEKLQGSIETYVFHERLTDKAFDDMVIEADYYYHEMETGVYMIAYNRGSNLTLKPAGKETIYFKGRYFKSVGEIINWVQDALPTAKTSLDSLEYEYPWLTCLKYPLEIGLQWTLREDGNPWRIDKKVEGTEKVNVPAGTFTCYKIQWLFDIDENEEWDDDVAVTDYICSEGLVRRYILIKDMLRTSEFSPEPLGTFDSSEEYILTSFSLK